jgi:hypothetical protein
LLDPRQPHRRANRATLLAGAVLLLMVGAALTYAAIDWRQHGCRCEASLYPDWAWIVLAILAAASFIAAAITALRALKRKAES